MFHRHFDLPDDMPGMFGGFGPGGPGGFRAGRGMIEPAILGALADKPMHGYEIISSLEEKTHGMWRPSPGSVYPTLQLLEEKDLVEVREDAGKKIYALTEAGRTAAEESKGLHDKFWEGKSGDFRVMHASRQQMMELMGLIHNISAQKNEAKIAKLHELIANLKAELQTLAGAE